MEGVVPVMGAWSCNGGVVPVMWGVVPVMEAWSGGGAGLDPLSGDGGRCTVSLFFGKTGINGVNLGSGRESAGPERAGAAGAVPVFARSSSWAAENVPPPHVLKLNFPPFCKQIDATT